MDDDFSTFMATGHASVVVGGQFGSEAKGLVASHIFSRISKYQGPIISTTNAGAQAGHTTILPDGTKFVCYHLPTLGVLHEAAQIYINAGAIIDPALLHDEVLSVAHALGRTEDSIWSRLVIHPHAAVITDDARRVEQMGATAHLGSTQKGVGAALAAKIMRAPDAVASRSSLVFGPYQLPGNARIEVLDLDRSTVFMEIPQGTSLSINSSGFYPKTTSRECWVGQGMVDAGLHPYMMGVTNMVMRTFPIRVGHIYAGDELVGNSGPFYEDGEEISWDDLPGVEPERTTVTKRVRRIAKWSKQQYVHGLKMNRPSNVFLTFTNYCTEPQLVDIVRSMRDAEKDVGLRVRHFYSWGPKSNEVSSNFGEARVNCRVPF